MDEKSWKSLLRLRPGLSRRGGDWPARIALTTSSILRPALRVPAAKLREREERRKFLGPHVLACQSRFRRDKPDGDLATLHMCFLDAVVQIRR